MTKLTLYPTSVASILLLAACPSPIDVPMGTDSDSEGQTTTGNGDTESDTLPPTTTMTTTPQPTTTGMSDSESETGTTMQVDPTTEEMVECQDDGECEGATPFCVNNACVDCNGTSDPDQSCADVSESTPACSVDGACVECTAENTSLCMGNKPVCDSGASQCVGCSMHAQCEESACNFETGACFDTSRVIYVDRLAPCDVGDGTMEQPYCRVAHAIDYMIQEGVDFGWTVKIRSGNYIEDPLVVPNGAFAVFSRWGEMPVRMRATNNTGPTLTIGEGAQVYLDRLWFNQNDSDNGVVCAAAKVWIDDVQFFKNDKQGYESTDCETRMNRSISGENRFGGIASYGVGSTWVINSQINANGTQVTGEYGGIRTAQGNELHVVYSTVVNNQSPIGPASLQCFEAGPTEVRNSVLIGTGLPSVDCLDGVFTNSALDEGALEGDTNLVATKADFTEFFEAYLLGVYLAKAGTALEGLAVWQSGDPTTDFNGTPRPNVDGEADYAGADRPR